MNKMLVCICTLILVILSPFGGSGGSFLYSQIPRIISYQGVLTNEAGNPKPDGDYSITFSFYESEAGGDAIWNEIKILTVTNGLFSTSLGNQIPFGDAIKFDKPYWLGIKVGDEAELSPRVALTSAGYSLTSGTALNVADGIAIKSLNGLKDDITLEGSGGTTINANGNTITISSSETGITGIQVMQNTDNTLDISGPNGPTATVNLKLPLVLNGVINTPEYLLTSNVTGTGGGIIGTSISGLGVVGQGLGTTGVNYGVAGNSKSPDGFAVSGWNLATEGDAVGVVGRTNSTNGIGVLGISNDGYAVKGSGHWAVMGSNPYSSSTLFGGLGVNTPEIGYAAVYGYDAGNAGSAGLFMGNVFVYGILSKSGGSFKIDHPLDPANKYLSHSFVESPDMMNIYNGNVTTDELGSAVITLPDWFDALNKDFRYQLTIVGDVFAQARVSHKISDNQFSIKTDKPNIEVSWQVTGIRKDAFAEKNRIQVEEFKSDKERGKYLLPELFGQPEEMGIYYISIDEPEINNRGITKTKGN
jgi:hypothetical protein